LLEFAAITSAWLIFVALQQHNRRRLFAGFVVTALLMQTYLAAMLMALQAAVVVLHTWRIDRRLFRAAVWGLGLCALSGLIYLMLLVANNLNPIVQLRAGLNNTPAQICSVPNPFGPLVVVFRAFRGSHTARRQQGRQHRQRTVRHRLELAGGGLHRQ
jgi:hypothetical protein